MRRVLALFLIMLVMAGCMPAVEQAGRAALIAAKPGAAPTAAGTAEAGSGTAGADTGATTVIASVDGAPITQGAFWPRLRYERESAQRLLTRYTQLEQQFGNQGYFTAQIEQLQKLLATSDTLASATLEKMIVEKLVAKEAARRQVVITDAVVEDALRAEIANAYGLITAPQATATATAEVAATATAATSQGESAPVAAQQQPAMIISDEQYAQGLDAFERDLKQAAGMTLDDYRELMRGRLLREQVSTAIGDAAVSPTEETVNARHILIRPGQEVDGTVLADDAAVLAFAQKLRAKIVAGESFADLAQAYSADPGSAARGGDLGWFGRGVMVAPFEEAAFQLPLNEVSQPVQTDFGYHLIEVLGHDQNHPRDEAALAQAYAQAFTQWVEAQLTSADIQRPAKLPLPPGF